jgi:hypothetical protein
MKQARGWKNCADRNSFSSAGNIQQAAIIFSTQKKK